MIRLAIAEDHQSIIDGIMLLLSEEDDISIVGHTNDGQALLELVENDQPDVIITDIKMPKVDGITATQSIKKKWPNIQVIAFTMFDQEEAIHQMLEAGASGYLLKSASLEEVLKAVKAVASGKKYFDANIAVDELSIVQNSGIDVLTARQNEILKLIAQGKTSRQIADELYIGVQTVETHRKNMARILGLQGKGELLRYALDRKYDFKSE